MIVQGPLVVAAAVNVAGTLFRFTVFTPNVPPMVAERPVKFTVPAPDQFAPAVFVTVPPDTDRLPLAPTTATPEN